MKEKQEQSEIKSNITAKKAIILFVVEVKDHLFYYIINTILFY